MGVVATAEVPEVIRYTVAGLLRRMDSIRTPGPTEPVLAAGLAVDVGDAYRAARLSGDTAAAAVLRRMLTDARGLATRHIRGLSAGRTGSGIAWFGLPRDAMRRARAIAAQLRLVDLYRASLTAGRDLAAAALVERGGWPLSEVATLARTAPRQIAAAASAAVLRPDVEADPGTVVELSDLIDALAGRAVSLDALRAETIRRLLQSGQDTRLVAAQAQVPPEYVAQLP